LGTTSGDNFAIPQDATTRHGTDAKFVADLQLFQCFFRQTDKARTQTKGEK